MTGLTFSSISAFDLMDEFIRAGWCTGSLCTVYSKTAAQWVSARVLRCFRDEEGEWLEVQYSGSVLKQLQRDSEDIRPHVEWSTCTSLTFSKQLCIMYYI